MIFSLTLDKKPALAKRQVAWTSLTHSTSSTMKNMPTPTGQSSLVTKKHFWMAAYLAALHRVTPAEALVEADEALRLGDERWRNPEHVAHWRWVHDFPLGHDFPAD